MLPTSTGHPLENNNKPSKSMGNAVEKSIGIRQTPTGNPLEICGNPAEIDGNSIRNL